MRPYIICHMITSLDGRIKADGCPQAFYSEYQNIEKSHEHDGWMCGRVTIEDFIGTAKFSPKNPSINMPRNDFIAAKKKKLYGVVIDPSGKLVWDRNVINEASIIAVLTEKVSDEYLKFLQSKKISYIFCGKTKIDLNIVLEKLVKKFKIKNLLLQGGGKMNGSMLREGLIDELSLLIAPAIEGTIGTSSVFDVNKTRKPAHILKLLSSKTLNHDIIWQRYAFNKS